MVDQFSALNVFRYLTFRTGLSVISSMVIVFLIYSSFGKGMFFENNASQELGLGYIFFIAGLPFSFLALIGVKKDKNLLDSLNRLR